MKNKKMIGIIGFCLLISSLISIPDVRAYNYTPGIKISETHIWIVKNYINGTWDDKTEYLKVVVLALTDITTPIVATAVNVTMFNSTDGINYDLQELNREIVWLMDMSNAQYYGGSCMFIPAGVKVGEYNATYQDQFRSLFGEPDAICTSIENGTGVSLLFPIQNSYTEITYNITNGVLNRVLKIQNNSNTILTEERINISSYTIPPILCVNNTCVNNTCVNNTNSDCPGLFDQIPGYPVWSILSLGLMCSIYLIKKKNRNKGIIESN